MSNTQTKQTQVPRVRSKSKIDAEDRTQGCHTEYFSTEYKATCVACFWVVMLIFESVTEKEQGPKIKARPVSSSQISAWCSCYSEKYVQLSNSGLWSRLYNYLWVRHWSPLEGDCAPVRLEAHRHRKRHIYEWVKEACRRKVLWCSLIEQENEVQAPVHFLFKRVDFKWN